MPRPSWNEDEAEFLRHFDMPHQEFCELICALPDAAQQRYEQIRQVDEKAAVLWAIDEGKSRGILHEQ